MRRVATLAFLVLGACAELGVVGDGTSVSVGKPSRGYLLDGARVPNSGDGFTTRDVWIHRGARYGTDELVELVTGVARRMHGKFKDVRIVVGDLSTRGGAGGDSFHRSHQSGRDADLLYYLRDASGKAVEPDAMHALDKEGVAKDGSGLHMDFARQWLLVKELLTAPEANVQWLFLYEPLAKKVLAHAADIGEDPELVARARKALRQPGDSAPHDDHMHVRVYCTDADKADGCEDMGPMELHDASRPGVAAQLPAELGKALAVAGSHWID
nr:penicillin-insensitive murein endopeptidase [Kofleriaceae bacterium]